MLPGLLVSLFTALQSASLLGTWVGDSRCVGGHPGCHDEHVLYRADSIGPADVTLHGFRIAVGDTVDMGPLACRYDRDAAAASCRIPVGTWTFRVVEGQLRGSLQTTDGAEARQVTARRWPRAR